MGQGQMGFYFDQERCIGCYACAVACKDKNDLPAGPAHWRRVRLTEDGRYPEVRLLRLSLSCNHCGEPACAAACPAGAITKRRQDGVVVVDRERCLGGDTCGRFCLEACPYDAPQFGAEPDPKMQKCDLCLDYLEAGQPPACAVACPMLALEAGLLEELEASHRVALSIEGVPDASGTCPSLRFRAPRMPVAPARGASQ